VQINTDDIINLADQSINESRFLSIVASSILVQAVIDNAPPTAINKNPVIMFILLF